MAFLDDDLDGNRAALEPVLLDDPFVIHIGAEVTGWGGGWARAELLVGPEHANLAGMAHGGVTFSLGDLVFAVSSNSWGRLSVALTVEVQYLAAVQVGTRLTAESHERHRTRRTAAYLIEVTAPASDSDPRSPSSDSDPRSPSSDSDPRSPSSDSDPRSSASDTLVASLHALVHRTDRWHLGEHAWSDAWRSAH